VTHDNLSVHVVVALALRKPMGGYFGVVALRTEISEPVARCDLAGPIESVRSLAS
jgi:hypothetical protein